MGVAGQCKAPATLSLGKRPGIHCRPHRDPIPGPSSQLQVLYRLSYPAVNLDTSQTLESTDENVATKKTDKRTGQNTETSGKDRTALELDHTSM
jgi:hypothetical protein